MNVVFIRHYPNDTSELAPVHFDSNNEVDAKWIELINKKTKEEEREYRKSAGVYINTNEEATEYLKSKPLLVPPYQVDRVVVEWCERGGNFKESDTLHIHPYQEVPG